MAKRNSNKKPATASPAVSVSKDNAETDTADAAVLAVLAGADDAAEALAAPAEVLTQTTEETPVGLEEADEDAVLAQLKADEDDTAKAKSTPKAKAEPKEPVVTREFCDIADHMDAAGLKTALDGINAKKVSEKANNVVSAITSGKKLSSFTALAINKLKADGHITSKSMVDAYVADGKSLGTARAQAQQQTALFKALGIAAPDSTDAKMLVACDNGLVKELELLAA